MNHPLAELILSRIREFYREPAAIFWVYGFPLLMALVLGTAFSSKQVVSIPVDMVIGDGADRANVEAIRDRWSKLDERKVDGQDEPGAGPLKIELHTEAESLERLRTTKTNLIVIPDTTAPGNFRFIQDQFQPSSVLAQSVCENIALRYNNPNAVQPKPEQAPDVSGSRYIDFLMPGLVGANLMGGGLFGVGFLIVDMRVRKLLKRFLATPMRKTDFMLAIMISRLLFTMIEIAILFGAAYLFFGVKIHGNIFALLLLVFLGGACFAGMGLMIASRAKTLETASGLMNAVMLPMYLVSGVFFRSDSFPEFVKPLIQILPLTALNNGLRLVVNEGAGFDALLWPIVILVSWGAVSYFVALKLFKWR